MLIRTAIVLVGCSCIFAAIFLYEDEEKKLQNRIEEWWVKLRYTHEYAVSKSVAFIQATAKLTGKGLDLVFGKKLLSVRTMGVSVCFSSASLLLFCLLGIRNHNVQVPYPPPIAPATTLLQAVLLLAFGLIPAMAEVSADYLIQHGYLAPEKWIQLVWSILLSVNVSQLLWGFMYPLYRSVGTAAAVYVPVVVGIAFGVSLICDLTCIFITRSLLRLASEVNKSYKLPVILLGNVVLVICVVIAPAKLGLALFNFSHVIAIPILFSIVLNLLNLVLCVAAVAVSALLLLHRLLWPVVERPIYLLQRYGAIRDKRMLWSSGLALIGLPLVTSTPWVKSLLTLLKHQP